MPSGAQRLDAGAASVAVAEMRITDLLRVAEIERRCYASPWSLNAFVADFLNRHSHRLVLRAGEPPRVVGFIMFLVVQAEMHISNVAVEPASRRRGVAEALLLEALRRAGLLGASTAFLEVRPSNGPARRLYDKLGFFRVSVRRRYYSDNSEDAWVLQRKLAPETTPVRAERAGGKKA